LSSSNAEPKKTRPYITILRFTIQILSFFIINYVILELIFQVDLSFYFEGLIKALPIQNSPRNSLSNGGGFVEYILYMINQADFPFLLLGLLILLSLLFSRSFCSFLCPIGTIQDVMALASRKKNRQISQKTHKIMINLKYAILAVLLVISFTLGFSKIVDPLFYYNYRANLGTFHDKPIGYFSLSEYIFVFFPSIIEEIVNTANIQVLFADFLTFFLFFFYIGVLIVSFYYPRVYCRYFCPFGAMSGIFSEYSFLKISRNPVKCTGRKECGICEKICPMQIKILDEKFEGFTGRGECILCLKCIEKCPYNALKLKFG